MVAALLAVSATTTGIGPRGAAEAAPATEAATESLPAGFEDTAVIAGLTDPTVVRFAPDGRVFVAEKAGRIKVFDGLDDRSATVVADLRTQVHGYWDRGLLGFNLDPQFPGKPYLYVLYAHDAAIGGLAPRWGDTCPTPPGPLTNGCMISTRLSRFELQGTSVGPEQVLVEDWCQQYPSHGAGDIEFGPDGSLYASGGDGASFTFNDYGQFGVPPNPCGDPPTPPGTALSAPTTQGGSLRSQDARTSADPLGLDGTIIRVNRTTGRGVATNPFPTRTGNWKRLVAYGLRNPFRLAFQPSSGDLYIADVGGGAYEEVERLVNPGAPVENFGWPCYEGPARMPAFDGMGVDLCEDLYLQPGAVTNPVFTYRHDSPVVPGESCPVGSSSLSGIAFYDGGSYPDEYDGALLLADYSRNCIWAVPPGGDPITLVDSAHGPVDLQIGPDGDVFYVDLIGGTIRRITWDELAPPSQSSYLSDLSWSAATNGWGPVERDTSNGEDQPLDGGPLTIGGASYAKGLGTNAASTITFPMGGQCFSFTADVGVDDEVGGNGTVQFVVKADGTERYRSPVLTGSDGPVPVQVDLTGVQLLKLQVLDGGDGSDADHGDWADAFVDCTPTGPEPLSTRAWHSAGNGFGPVEIDHSNGEDGAGDGGTLTLAGVTYGDGFGTHAPSRIVYDLEPGCTGLTADIGVDDEAGPNGSVQFRVEGSGGRVLYESALMRADTPTRHLDLDLAGQRRIKLIVTDGGDGSGGDHADWAVPRLTCDDAPAAGQVHIDAPLATTHWRVGNVLAFSGGAETTTGVPLAASRLTWTLVMQHCPSNCHSHVIQTWRGVRAGTFLAPDHEYPSHLELRLTAHMPNGATVVRRRDLDPSIVRLTFASSPTGLPLVVGATSEPTPFSRTVMIGSVNSVAAPSTATVLGGTANFASWSDGGARNHTVTAPTRDARYRATYTVTP